MIRAITPFTGFKTEPGDGLHRTISRAVYRLCLQTSDDQYIINKIKPMAMANQKRPLQPREVENLVKMHREKLADPTPEEDRRKRPAKNRAFTETIARKSNLSDLKEHTGLVPIDTKEALKRLYAKNDWLYVGSTMWDCVAMTAGEWAEHDLSKFSMIMPNPFTPNPPARRGKYVRERLFVIYESDEPWMTHDMQAGVIMHLRKQMPLRMVVSSGNSSLHAWFDISFATPSQREEFEDNCHMLSGDPATLRPNHLVRLPWGTNPKTNNRQEVIYFR